MTAIGQPVRHVWKLSVLRVALWALIAAGPLVAGAVWARLDDVSQRLSDVVGQAADAPSGSTSDVEGVAELALADLLASRSTDGAMPTPVQTVSLGAEELESGHYAVTVAAAQVGDTETHFRFYMLSVVSTSSGWAISGPPALIGGPHYVEAPEMASGMRSLDATTELMAAVEGFLTAFLLGDGDVARYTAPRSSLSAVTPPPFAVVEVVEAASTPMQSGGHLVVVGVEGTRSTSHVEVLEYWLVMEERDGRWEVADLLPAPPLNTTTGRGEQ